MYLHWLVYDQAQFFKELLRVDLQSVYECECIMPNLNWSLSWGKFPNSKIKQSSNWVISKSLEFYFQTAFMDIIQLSIANKSLNKMLVFKNVFTFGKDKVIVLGFLSKKGQDCRAGKKPLYGEKFHLAECMTTENTYMYPIWTTI